MIGSDLSVSAQILSDLVSRPSSHASAYYRYTFQPFVHEGAALADCENDPCEVDEDGSKYVVSFTGDIFQDDIPKEEWTEAMKNHFASNKDTIYQNCNFKCYHEGKALIPDI